jgi:hypothetical protein
MTLTRQSPSQSDPTPPRVTDGAFPSAATTATKETTLDETVDVDATTEVAG